jgi:hypothetical protein
MGLFIAKATQKCPGTRLWMCKCIKRALNVSQVPAKGMTAEKRKRAIEYIHDGCERQEKFQKRLEGIMKKAHELAVMTGNQVFLLMASESGSVHSYATAKFEKLLSPSTEESFFKDTLFEAGVDLSQISESQSWSTQEIYHPDIEMQATPEGPIQFHQVAFQRSGTPIFDDTRQSVGLTCPKVSRHSRSASITPMQIHHPVPMKRNASNPAPRRMSAVSQSSMFPMAPPPIPRPMSAMGMGFGDGMAAMPMPFMDQSVISHFHDWMGPPMNPMGMGMPMCMQVPDMQTMYHTQLANIPQAMNGLNLGMPTMPMHSMIDPTYLDAMAAPAQITPHITPHIPGYELPQAQPVPQPMIPDPQQMELNSFLERELDGMTPPVGPHTLKIQTSVPQAPHVNSAVSNGSTLTDFNLPSPIAGQSNPSIVP